MSYDSPFWVQYERVPSIIDPTHTVQTITGAATLSGFKTGEVGDDEAYTDLQYVRLRCIDDPTSGTMYGQHRESLGASDFEERAPTFMPMASLIAMSRPGGTR